MLSDELVEDVSSAESLNERHSEHKSALESRDDSLYKILKNGHDIAISKEIGQENRQFIEEKIRKLELEREELGNLLSYQEYFVECMKLSVG
jgi:hypothetical protein